MIPWRQTDLLIYDDFNEIEFFTYSFLEVSLPSKLPIIDNVLIIQQPSIDEAEVT